MRVSRFGGFVGCSNFCGNFHMSWSTHIPTCQYLVSRFVTKRICLCTDIHVCVQIYRDTIWIHSGHDPQDALSLHFFLRKRYLYLVADLQKETWKIWKIRQPMGSIHPVRYYVCKKTWQLYMDDVTQRTHHSYTRHDTFLCTIYFFHIEVATVSRID